MTFLSQADKRALGAFYTPLPVARKLVDWALRPGVGTVLDPSFGGCSFLRAAADHLQANGVRRTARLVHGVDVDPLAQRHLARLNTGRSTRASAVIGDFFSLDVSKLVGAPFSAVVGNPPYLRHHVFAGEQRASARAATIGAAPQLSETTNAWAYFIVHALSMLAPKGRLAFILPGAALQADYAKPVLELLESRFLSTSLVYLRQRLFTDTDQDSVLLLARGHLQGAAPASYAEIESMRQFHPARRLGVSGRVEAAPTSLKEATVGRECMSILEQIDSNHHLKRVDELATIRIGVVTGANSFFIRHAADIARFRAPGVRYDPVIARTAQFTGPYWTAADQKGLERSGAKSVLLKISADASLPPALKQEVRAAEREGLSKRFKCRRRLPWYSLEEEAIPDAFIRYMSGSDFWIVQNKARATCTNAIHRLWWKHSRVASASVVAGTWTTLFQLECELAGRAYGGGVLKIEPGELARMRVPVVPGAGRALPTIARHCAKGDLDAARRLADELVLCRGLGMSARKVDELRSAVMLLRDRRRGN